MDAWDGFGVDITVNASATRCDGGVLLRLTVEVPPGHHVYAPSADDGRPMAITVPEGSPFALADVVYPESDDGHVDGKFEITVVLGSAGEINDGDEVEVAFAYQLCEPTTCLMPATRRVIATVA